MELVNDFTVSVPIDEAWVTLTNVEKIAPCLPGAQLQEIEGDEYRGVVKIKVGPIVAQFKGKAVFVEKDDTNHKAVLRAEGRDTGGKGNASALITAQLEPQGDSSTHVTVSTDLTITGKVAQFGRGALADVSTKLLTQFVDQLETRVLNEPAKVAASEGAAFADAGTEGAMPTAPAAVDPASAPAAAATASAPATEGAAASANGETAAPTVRKIQQAETAPIDLLGTAGAPLVKRLVPVLIGVIVLAFLVRRRRRRSKG